MAKKRALESQTETESRQQQNRARIAKKRALESQTETEFRQQQDRARIAKKRALESQTETKSRQQQNRAHMARDPSAFLLIMLFQHFCLKQKWVRILYAHVVIV